MESDARQPGSDRQAGAFATTRWSLVISAGGTSSPDSKQALETLCETYWYPLYAYVRRRVPDVHQAQDLTQSFFAELLEKNVVGTATPDRGRFRAFLLTAFKHFLSKQREKEHAQKRGGGRVPASLDFEAADSKLSFEPAARLTAEQFYDQQWALALIAQILSRLKAESIKAGKLNQFEALKGFVIGDHAGTTYSQVAENLNISEAAAKKSASRMRERYRELLREEIAQTVSSSEEVDDEIHKLFAVLRL